MVTLAIPVKNKVIRADIDEYGEYTFEEMYHVSPPVNGVLYPSFTEFLFTLFMLCLTLCWNSIVNSCDSTTFSESISKVFIAREWLEARRSYPATTTNYFDLAVLSSAALTSRRPIISHHGLEGRGKRSNGEKQGSKHAHAKLESW
jgi:hypothetical protein